METTTNMRISKTKLAKYIRNLSENDRAILHSIEICKFLKTEQISRLHFRENVSKIASLRATTRTLAKLRKCGLIEHLKRRIGGVRAGSTSYIWTLKEAGVQLLEMSAIVEKSKQNIYKKSGEIVPKKSRKRVYEPTLFFLKHTLEIAELYTFLRTKTNLQNAEFEPKCWREYSADYGINYTLKPDLYAVTQADNFEDYWFFEVDRDTEAPTRILKKCGVYGKYYITGAEQKRTGVFPKVVWIVPDLKRKETLKRHISEKISELETLFVVVAFEELDGLINGDSGLVIGQSSK
jgi:hypothetical protein